MQSPENWYNINGDFKLIFESDKSVSVLTDDEYKGTDSSDMTTGLIFKNIPAIKSAPGYIEVRKNNQWKIPIGITTKFH